jgi:hypothetical protein
LTLIGPHEDGGDLRKGRKGNGLPQQRAKPRGISASMITLSNKGHEILGDPAVIKEVSQAVQ